MSLLITDCSTAGGLAPSAAPGTAGLMPSTTLPPPPGLQSVPARTGSDRSGTNTGQAEPLDTGDGVCLNTPKVSGFHVSDSRVRFGGFHGTGDADNGLQMAYGSQWIIGQFDGTISHGQLVIAGRPGPGGSYRMTLEQVRP